MDSKWGALAGAGTGLEEVVTYGAHDLEEEADEERRGSKEI